MLRVAMLTLYPLELTQVQGGIRMVSLNLVEALRGYEDLELHVVHCHGDTKVPRTVTHGRVTLHYLATPRWHVLPNLTASVSRVGRLLSRLQPDLVHAHVGHLAYAGVRAGLPTIYTIHGVVARERAIYSQNLYDRMRYGLLDHYERRALPKASCLVAISDHVQQAYQQQRADLIQGVAWARIDNPVPDAFFQVDDACQRPTILYAGSITEIKDLLTLLQAVERLVDQVPELELRMAGCVLSPAYAAQLQAFVRAHDLADHVTFLGLLDRQALLHEYAQASLLALTSLQENAPMAVIEAMAAARPVVATAVGGVPDLVQEGETGWLVPAGDDVALARRMQMLLSDDDLRRAMGGRARQVARQRFGAQQVAAAYHDLYHRVAAQGGSD